MSPESIQEVIRRHTSHFTSLQGKEYHWYLPKVAEIRSAIDEAENELMQALDLEAVTYSLPMDQYRELLGDIYKALQIRRQELL